MSELGTAAWETKAEAKAYDDGYNDGYDDALADMHSALITAGDPTTSDAIALAIIEDLINAG